MYCFLFSFFLPYSFFLVYHAWLPFLLSCPAPTGHLVHRPGSAALWFFVPGAEKCACPENPPAPLRPHRTPFIGVNRLPSGIASRSSCPALTGHLVHRPGSVHRRRSSPVRHCLSFVMPGTDRASRSSSGLRCALGFRSRRREMRLPRKPTRSAPPSSAGVYRRMIIFKDSKFFVSLSYGNEDQECVVLYLVWERESEMDGTVSCLRRMEYDGGRAEGTEGIEGRSGRWCGRTAACLYRCRGCPADAIAGDRPLE